VSTEATTTPAESSGNGLLLLIFAFVAAGVGAMFFI
jgi:hypothetical protein